MTFIGLTGIATGIFTVFRFDQWLKDQISANILNIISNSDKISMDMLTVLLYAVFNDAIFFIVMFISSFHPLAIPLGICAFLIRGFYIGLAFAIILMSCGWFLIAEALIFMLAFPTFVILSVRCANLAILRSKAKAQHIIVTNRFIEHLRAMMPFITFTIFINVINVLLVYLTIKVFY